MFPWDGKSVEQRKLLSRLLRARLGKLLEIFRLEAKKIEIIRRFCNSFRNLSDAAGRSLTTCPTKYIFKKRPDIVGAHVSIAWSVGCHCLDHCVNCFRWDLFGEGAGGEGTKKYALAEHVYLVKLCRK